MGVRSGATAARVATRSSPTAGGWACSSPPWLVQRGAWWTRSGSRWRLWSRTRSSLRGPSFREPSHRPADRPRRYSRPQAQAGPRRRARRSCPTSTSPTSTTARPGQAGGRRRSGSPSGGSTSRTCPRSALCLAVRPRPRESGPRAVAAWVAPSVTSRSRTAEASGVAWRNSHCAMCREYTGRIR